MNIRTTSINALIDYTLYAEDHPDASRIVHEENGHLQIKDLNSDPASDAENIQTKEHFASVIKELYGQRAFKAISAELSPKNSSPLSARTISKILDSQVLQEAKLKNQQNIAKFKRDLETKYGAEAAQAAYNKHLHESFESSLHPSKEIMKLAREEAIAFGQANPVPGLKNKAAPRSTERVMKKEGAFFGITNKCTLNEKLIEDAQKKVNAARRDVEAIKSPERIVARQQVANSAMGNAENLREQADLLMQTAEELREEAEQPLKNDALEAEIAQAKETQLKADQALAKAQKAEEKAKNAQVIAERKQQDVHSGGEELKEAEARLNKARAEVDAIKTQVSVIQAKGYQYVYDPFAGGDCGVMALTFLATTNSDQIRDKLNPIIDQLIRKAQFEVSYDPNDIESGLIKLKDMLNSHHFRLEQLIQDLAGTGPEKDQRPPAYNQITGAMREIIYQIYKEAEYLPADDVAKRDLLLDEFLKSDDVVNRRAGYRGLSNAEVLKKFPEFLDDQKMVFEIIKEDKLNAIKSSGNNRFLDTEGIIEFLDAIGLPLPIYSFEHDIRRNAAGDVVKDIQEVVLKPHRLKLEEDASDRMALIVAGRHYFIVSKDDLDPNIPLPQPAADEEKKG